MNISIPLRTAIRRGIKRRCDDPAHAMRVSTKRARALLRLSAAPARKSVIHHLHDIASMLAPIREKRVLAELCVELRPPVKSERAKLKFDLGVRLSPTERETIHRAKSELAQIQRQLIRTNGLRDVARSEAVEALTESYRDGRRRAWSCVPRGKPNAFHDWRKKAKTLQYQLEFLQSRRPGSAKQLKKLRKLTELLGRMHDLAVLEGKLKKMPGASREFRLKVRREQIVLAKSALKTGRDIFGKRTSEWRRVVGV